MGKFFTWDEMTRDLAIVVGIVFIMYVSSHITPVTFGTVVSGEAATNLLSFLKGKVDMSQIQNLFLSIQSILAVVGVIFLAGVFWVTLKIREIHHKEHEKYEPVHVEEIEAKAKLIQWQVVLDHVNSESPAEWKLAILEADSMLDEILDFEGYQGESVGEKLKSMDPGDLPSYSDAWEAHKVRNQIAHEGAATMDFSKKIARDTITKFGKVFKDLGHI